ncbi:hypothetical protein IGI04_006092 [Brassica rapa subsp. trilocularis]|uniref:Uncharacterized protein n=1 Tax=Brassica rapa subsp. trilocularis TaxID=1813537 RepID=A0ABQ7NFV1_BRACM|nr:hypothetical protein IGI04_006092 [Brassica rapa subsp. trilocularis]
MFLLNRNYITSAEEETWSSLLKIMEAIVDQSPPTLLLSEICKRTQSKLCKGTNGVNMTTTSGVILHRCMVSGCNA